MKFRIPRPSPALFVAILALIVAMSGSAYAIAAQNGDHLIAKRTLSGNRLRLNTVTGREVANLAWHNLTLSHGWQNYNGTKRPPAWAIDAEGIIHLRGAIDEATGSNPIFARLPVSIRPSVEVWLTTDMSNASTGRVNVDADGFMHAEATLTFNDAQNFTNLDGITWAR